MKTWIRKAALASAAAVLAYGAAAHAALAPISDTLFVYDPTGAVFASAFEFEAGEDPFNIVTVNGVAVDTNQFGNPTLLIEPKTGFFSDIVGICTCGPGGQLALGFASDNETASVNFGDFPLKVPENGPLDVTMYLAPELRDAGFTAVFTSDGDGVPEPAAWSLMIAGFGLAGAGLRRRSARVA